MDSGGRRRARVRAGSVTSATTSFPGPDPQRESELSVVTENLTLEDLEGNVFRMSKDQVRTVGCVFCFERGSRGGGGVVWCH